MSWRVRYARTTSRRSRKRLLTDHAVCMFLISHAAKDLILASKSGHITVHICATYMVQHKLLGTKLISEM